jgi:methionyl-tRNA formyltransferase
VLFFGMTGILSRVPLTLLLNAGVDVCGLVMPASILPPFLLPADGRVPYIPQVNLAQGINLMPKSNILDLAAQQQLPVYPNGRLRDEETIEMITAVKPDLICVSCFNQILPSAMLQIPKYGCLNLHPSWLPQFRGPSPLFWQLQTGQNEIGVTVHFMDEGVDTGDIILQEKITLRDGLSGAQIEQMCAERGGRLLLQAVQLVGQNSLPRLPQAGTSSYQPAPTHLDFELDLTWSAQRAFNFIRGTQEYGRPYFIQIGERKLWLDTAVAYDPIATQAQPIQRQYTNIVNIQFSAGVLTAQTMNSPM